MPVFTVTPAAAPTDGGGSYAWTDPGFAQTQDSTYAINSTASGTPTNRLTASPNWDADLVGEVYAGAPFIRARRAAGSTADTSTTKFRMRTLSSELFTDDFASGAYSGVSMATDQHVVNPLILPTGFVTGEDNWTPSVTMTIELIRAGVSPQNPPMWVDTFGMQVLAWTPKVDTGSYQLVRPTAFSQDSESAGIFDWANLSNLGDISQTTRATCVCDNTGGTDCQSTTVSATFSISGTPTEGVEFVDGSAALKEIRVYFTSLKLDATTPSAGMDGKMKLNFCRITNAGGDKVATTTVDELDDGGYCYLSDETNYTGATATGRIVVSFRDSGELAEFTADDLADARVLFSFSYTGASADTDSVTMAVGMVQIEARWNTLADPPEVTSKPDGAYPGETIALTISTVDLSELVDPVDITARVNVAPLTGDNSDDWVDLDNNGDGTFKTPDDYAGIYNSEGNATLNTKLDLEVELTAPAFGDDPVVKTATFTLRQIATGAITAAQFHSYITDMVLEDLFDEKDQPSKATKPIK